jgi:uncharacterized membrane protein YbhN (UPF0104 family)
MAGAWCAARSLDVELPLVGVLFTTGVLGLGSAVPSAPGFIGTYHWIAASSLELFDAAPADALAFAVLLHAMWFLPTTLAGIIVAVKMGQPFLRVPSGVTRREAAEAIPPPVPVDGDATA